MPQVLEEQKANEKTYPSSNPASSKPKPAFDFSTLNLTNLVTRNENNQALFNQLSMADNTNMLGSLTTDPFNGAFKTNFLNYSEEFDIKRVKMAGEMAKDQLGCRLLQKWLDLQNPEINKEIFANVIESFGVLMRDPFGNYLCQKLIEISNAEQIKRIIEGIYKDFLEISINQHGTRALQKLLENLRDEGNYQRMILLIREKIFELINDNNGNHVIQKCLQTFNCDQKQFIYDVCVTNCVQISNHKHGFFSCFQ